VYLILNIGYTRAQRKPIPPSPRSNKNDLNKIKTPSLLEHFYRVKVIIATVISHFICGTADNGKGEHSEPIPPSPQINCV